MQVMDAAESKSGTKATPHKSEQPDWSIRAAYICSIRQSTCDSASFSTADAAVVAFISVDNKDL